MECFRLYKFGPLSSTGTKHRSLLAPQGPRCCRSLQCRRCWHKPRFCTLLLNINERSRSVTCVNAELLAGKTANFSLSLVIGSFRSTSTFKGGESPTLRICGPYSHRRQIGKKVAVSSLATAAECSSMEFILLELNTRLAMQWSTLKSLSDVCQELIMSCTLTRHDQSTCPGVPMMGNGRIVSLETAGECRRNSMLLRQERSES